MDWTREQVDNLAPDAPSIKAGGKVFAKGIGNVCCSSRAIWVEIQGSGKKPYFTQLDREDIAFKCSCPSRKFPCKHGLALGYHLSSFGEDSVTDMDEPIWVSEWIDKRRTKSTATVSKVVSKKSIEKKEKNKQNRWVDASSDIEYIERWLQDSIKKGLLDFPNKRPSDWDKITKAMVDKKLTGINIYIRQLSIIDYSSFWEDEVLRILRKLHLLVKTIRSHESLDSEFKSQLAQSLGWYQTKQELLDDDTTEVIDDIWIVLKVDYQEDDNLKSRKVYLYGCSSNRWAYILDFSFAGRGFGDVYIQENYIQAKLAFYGGIIKQRAVLKVRGQNSDRYEGELDSFVSLKEANIAYQYQKMAYPFIFDMPQHHRDISIVDVDGSYILVDIDENTMPIVGFDFELYSHILAHTKGEKFDAFFLRNEKSIEMLAIIKDRRIITL